MAISTYLMYRDVYALTSDGDIEIDDLKGNLEARTSDGDIEISHLSGSIQAQTSDGSIHIKMDQDPTGDCSLKTSDGDIDISIGQASSLLITARVSDGSIRNKLPDSTTLSVEKTLPNDQSWNRGNKDTGQNIRWQYHYRVLRALLASSANETKQRSNPE